MSQTETTFSLTTRRLAWEFYRAVDAHGIRVGFPSLGAPWTVRALPRSTDDVRTLEREFVKRAYLLD